MDPKNIDSRGEKMQVVETIKRNPFSPSPRGHIADAEQLVGREEIIVDFWEAIDRACANKFIPIIIRAPYGGGKTTFLQWIKKVLDDKHKLPKHIASKNILVVYTKLPHPSIKNITTTFFDAVKLQLDKDRLAKLHQCVKKMKLNLRKKAIKTEHIFNVLLYNNCLDTIYAFGIDVIVHIIDEFEAISEISSEECRGFLHEFRDFIDEIGERPLVLILGCTDEAYRLLEEIHPALLSRVPEEFRKKVDNQLGFTLENTLEFVASRLETVREINPDLTNPYYPFEREAIELLYEKTGGNIRMIEQACYFALERATKENRRIDQRAIIDALHQVISQKSGLERTEELYNLIDDPKVRDELTTLIRKGDPDKLKDLLYEAFKIFLAKQNFDYQFERDDDSIGEKVGIARINTHAYRTIPIEIAFLPTTIPKEFEHSDIADLEKLRENTNVGLGILLRITQNEKITELLNENIIDVSIPWEIFKEFCVLPHISHLDAERISRKLEDELKIITFVNKWIRNKIENGQIVGERFRQHEISVYLLLWRLGDSFHTIDKVYKFSRQRNRKYSKVTLIARLSTLEEKGLVIKKDNSVKWTISPLMKKINQMISQKFNGNPVTPMDLKPYFMGGSIETLQKYLQLMVEIGILETVKVGRHVAYKTRKLDDSIQQIAQIQHDIESILAKISKMPYPIRIEIDEKRLWLQDSLKSAQNAINTQDELLALANLSRAKMLLDEIKLLESELGNESIVIEKEYEMISRKIENIIGSVETCKRLGIDVSTYLSNIETIRREAIKLYENDFKTQGKTSSVIETFNQLNSQLSEIDGSLSRILDLYDKLIENLKRSKYLLKSISIVCRRAEFSQKVSSEDLTRLHNLLAEAEKALERKEFAKAEFLFLKILQDDLVRQTLFELNMKFSEICAEATQVKELVTIAARINPGTNIIPQIQDTEALIQETKSFLEQYNLENVVNNIEKITKNIDKLRNDSINILVQWFYSVLPRDFSPVTPHELSRNFGIPFETVLQASCILLKNNKLGIVRREGLD
ncbi:MAG: hypothetical protein QXF61_03000 [Nitrososphaeria archaeon]